MLLFTCTAKKLNNGQFQNADIEKLLEKYQDELVGAMESINREVEEAPSSDSSEGTDSDDEFLAEMARVSMTMLPLYLLSPLIQATQPQQTIWCK